MKEIVELLLEKNMTISTMESCTGGSVASAITNIEGSSDVIHFSAVTYSNEYKIKMGVKKEIIDKYSVYSMNTAEEMSKSICEFANSDIGVGITGKIHRADKNNPFGDDFRIYISIFEKKSNKFYNRELVALDKSRQENKEYIIENIVSMLKDILT